MRAALNTLISLSILTATAASCGTGKDATDETASMSATDTDSETTSTPSSTELAVGATNSAAPTAGPTGTPNATSGAQSGEIPGQAPPTPAAPVTGSDDDTDEPATDTSAPAEGEPTDEEVAPSTDSEAATEDDSTEATADESDSTDSAGTESDESTAADATETEAADPTLSQLEPFSFFVTSLAAIQDLSGSDDGFGGDLRYGEADGLTGADKICTEIAERSMPGAGAKEWHAFLSVTKGGPDDGPIHAIDRVGEGPWYDRLGRVIALDKEALVNQRPEGIDPDIELDLPNEDGVPNHAPDGELVDNHDMLTGTNDQGQLYIEDGDPAAATCNDWTSAEPSGAPRVGHPWPTGAGRQGGGAGGGGFGGGTSGPGGAFGDMANWMSALTEAGCAPGVFLVEMGGPDADNPTVGSGGGYGGFYCFAMNP